LSTTPDNKGRGRHDAQNKCGFQVIFIDFIWFCEKKGRCTLHALTCAIMLRLLSAATVCGVVVGAAARDAPATVKVWHLTDVHVDPYYVVRTNKTRVPCMRFFIVVQHFALMHDA
jgi:hypothetical protein